MLYGASVWDPVLIVFQIVALQCLFYLGLGLWHVLLLGSYVGRLTIICLFSYKTFSFSTYVGWVDIIASLLNAVLGSVFLLWIVERAKKCLDFASTTYFLHLCFSWGFDGFPARFEWWATNIACLVIMALLGEWLCLRREMQEIPLNTLRDRRAAGGTGGQGVEMAASSSSAAPSGAAGSKGLMPKGGMPRGDLPV